MDHFSDQRPPRRKKRRKLTWRTLAPGSKLGLKILTFPEKAAPGMKKWVPRQALEKRSCLERGQNLKSDDPYTTFSCFLGARTFKIKQKRCTVVQNRRYHRFLEKHRLVRNTPESKPQRDPRNPTKSKKTQTGPPLKTCTGVAGSGQVAERPGRASQTSEPGVPPSPVSIFTYRYIFSYVPGQGTELVAD